MSLGLNVRIYCPVRSSYVVSSCKILARQAGRPVAYQNFEKKLNMTPKRLQQRSDPLQKALDFPAFLLGVYVLYWSVPLSIFLGKIQFWNLRGKRDDAYGWGRGLQILFGIKAVRLPGPSLYRGENVIYLVSKQASQANHRCWADFFLDVLVTEGRAQMLSRFAVLLVFPAFMVCVWAIKAVILFKRGSKINKELFNEFIDKKIRESPCSGLIVYPEGHRSTRKDSLPLKRGMLHFCYEYKHSVQIVITANKEAVLSEKDMRSHFGQTVMVGYANPIHPSDSPTFEDFMEKVQRAWDAEWQRVYSADWNTAVALKPMSLQVHNYPLQIKILQIVFQLASCLFFFVVTYWTVRGARLVFSVAGPYRSLLAALLVLWVGASLSRSLRPVRYPLAPQPSPTS